MEFVSISEAIKLTNKSESTIRRLIRKSPEEFVRKNTLDNGAEKWMISKIYLQKNYSGLSTGDVHHYEKQVFIDDHKKEDNDQSFLLIQEKDKRIDDLKMMLESLNGQLNDKNRQINELLDTNKEYQMILDRVNQALISLRLPEWVKSHEIPISQDDFEKNYENSHEGNATEEEHCYEDPTVSEAHDLYRKNKLRDSKKGNKNDYATSFAEYLKMNNDTHVV